MSRAKLFHQASIDQQNAIYCSIISVLNRIALMNQMDIQNLKIKIVPHRELFDTTLTFLVISDIRPQTLKDGIPTQSACINLSVLILIL